MIQGKKKLFFIGIAVFFLALFSLSYREIASTIASYFEESNQNISGIILFYGDGCNQCATVDDFVKKNNVEEKVLFTRLEVFDDSANANVLADRAQICGLSVQDYGVPFLWDGQNCIIGYVDVIKFFQEKIAKKTKNP